jgi:hypothetical protein
MAAAIASPSPEEGTSRSNVKVLCRFRPMNSKEKGMGTKSVIHFDKSRTDFVKMVVRGDTRCQLSQPAQPFALSRRMAAWSCFHTIHTSADI